MHIEIGVLGHRLSQAGIAVRTNFPLQLYIYIKKQTSSDEMPLRLNLFSF